MLLWYFTTRSVPSYLSEDLERVQKRALKIILNDQSYTDCLSESNLQTLYARRQLLSERTFADVLSNQSNNSFIITSASRV